MTENRGARWARRCKKLGLLVLSLLVTFGGLYFLWKGFLWVKYVVFVSGAFMTLSFVGAALVVLVHLVRKPQTGSR